jgi:uncharacterized membrane protein
MILDSVIMVLLVVVIFTIVGVFRFKWIQSYCANIEKIYREHPEWFSEDNF